LLKVVLPDPFLVLAVANGVGDLLFHPALELVLAPRRPLDLFKNRHGLSSLAASFDHGLGVLGTGLHGLDRFADEPPARLGYAFGNSHLASYGLTL
jgi:hypothetical protein